MFPRTMADEPEHPTPDPDSPKAIEAAARADANPNLVATARFIRRLLPGEQGPGKSLSTTGQLRRRLSAQLSSSTAERPSAMRELGLGALQAWEALSEAQRRRRGSADVAILFTDLVGFSDWALAAGDEAALEVLRQVGDAEQKAISSNKGAVVKRLGDGAMAVFSDAEQAVEAALESQRAISKIQVDG